MRRALLLLAVLNTLNYLDRMVFSAVAPHLQSDLNLSNGQIGTLMSAFMVGYIAFSPIFGYLGDRWHKPKLMAAGLIAFSLATVATAYASTFWMLLIARIMVGVGEASFVIIAPAYIGERAPNEVSANRALAIFYAALPLGTALGYAAGGLLGSRVGWQSVFIIAGLPGLLLILPTLNLHEEPMDTTIPAINLPDFFRSMGNLLSSRPYMRTLIGYCAAVFAGGGFSFWATSFGVKVLRADLQTVNYGLGAVVLGSAVAGTVIGGKFGTRMVRPNFVVGGLTRFGAIMAFLSFPFCLAAIQATSLAVFFGALFVSMMFFFAAMSPVNLALLKAAPNHLGATAMAVSNLAVHACGDVFSTALIGILADSFPLQMVMGVLPFFLIIAGFAWWGKNSRQYSAS